MKPERIRQLAIQALEIDEQRGAFERALDGLSNNDRLAIELLLAESGPLSGLGLGWNNKLELLGKVAVHCAVHDMAHRWQDGRAAAQEEQE